MKLNQLAARLRLSVDQVSHCLKKAFETEDIVWANRNVSMLEERILLSASPLAEAVVGLQQSTLPPVLSGIEGTNATYVEDGTPIQITNSISIADVDDTDLASATVQIISNFSLGDQLLFTDIGPITHNWDAATGTLTLSGSDSLANYATALRNIYFENTNDDPTALTRSIGITVNDGHSDSNMVTRAIDVIPVNDPPTITLDPSNLAYAVGQVAVDPHLTVTDVDHTQLVGAMVELRSGFLPNEDRLVFADQLGIVGSYDIGTGVLTLTGTASVADYQTALRSVRYENINATPTLGTLQVRMQVDDGTNTSAWALRTIEIIDDQPPLAIDDVAFVSEGTSIIIDLSGNDNDNNNLLDLSSITIKSGPSFGTLVDNFDGTFTYIHNGSESLSDSFTYSIRDNFGLESNDATVSITVAPVNDAPVVNIVPSAYGVNEDDHSRLLSSISITDADADTDNLQITISVNDGSVALDTLTALTVVGGGNGTNRITVEGSLTDLNNALATLRYTPDPNFFGYDLLTIVADDLGHHSGLAMQHQDTATIVVSPVNDDPDVAGPVNVGASEDDSAFVIDLLTGASDVELDSLNASGVTLVSGNGAGIVVAGNSLNVDPSAYDYLAFGESEVIIYIYNVVDGNGGSTPQSATVIISGENDTPTVGAYVSAGSTEDDSIFLVDLLGDAIDPDSTDTLMASDITLVSGNAAGITVVGNNLIVDPAAYNGLAVGESEIVTYSYNIEDSNGSSIAQTAVITITGVNDNPIISSVLTSTASQNDPTYLIDLLIHATDPDTSDSLNVVGLTLISGNARGITAIGNQISVDPSYYSYLGTSDVEVVVYHYDVIDENGGIVSQTASITIIGTNEDPVVSGPILSNANEDDLTFEIDLLSGVTDPDHGDTLNISGLTLLAGDDRGVTRSGNTLNIDPHAYNELAVGETEVITFNYELSDENGGNVAQSATITITGANDDPLFIGPVNLNTTEDSPALQIEMVDLFLDVDINDALDLSVVSVLHPWLNVSIDSSNRLWLMPDDDQNGTTSVTVAATDTTGATTVSQIVVNVAPENDTVLVHDQDLVTEAGSPITGVLLADTIDVDNEALTIVITDPVENGILTINSNGTFTFEPDKGFAGDTSFAFAVDDGVELSGEAVIEIRVLENAVPAPGSSDSVNVVQDNEGSAEAAADTSIEVSIVESDVVILVESGSVSVDFGGSLHQQASTAAPIFVLSAPLVQAHVQDPDALADTGRTATIRANSVLNESVVRQLSGSVNLAALTIINEPGLLWQELDEMRNDSRYVTTLDALAVGSVGTVTSSLIVGYVVWAIRSGLLLSSIVATMPAWNLLDPLAIIPVADSDGSNSGETLEDIVEIQKSKIGLVSG